MINTLKCIPRIPFGERGWQIEQEYTIIDGFIFYSFLWLFAAIVGWGHYKWELSARWRRGPRRLDPTMELFSSHFPLHFCICITAHFVFVTLFGLCLFFCLFWLNWWLRHNLLDIKFLLFQPIPPPSCVCICICICKWFWVLYIFCCFVFVFVSYFCLGSLQS